MTAVPEDQDLWLFGYGSLIWKPPPHFDKRVPGYVEGYVRRFWQASEDHRGTPEAPGRVVTLIPRAHWQTLSDVHRNAPARTWGAAYRIPAKHVKEVKEQLDIREINGYSIDFAAFFEPVHVPSSGEGDGSGSSSQDPAPIRALVYIGLPDNPQFLGPQDPDALAEHIVKSRGPSGENREYVYLLAQSLDELRDAAGLEGVEVDEHVHDLARRVKEAEIRLEGSKA